MKANLTIKPVNGLSAEAMSNWMTYDFDLLDNDNSISLNLQDVMPAPLTYILRLVGGEVEKAEQQITCSDNLALKRQIIVNFGYEQPLKISR